MNTNSGSGEGVTRRQAVQEIAAIGALPFVNGLLSIGIPIVAFAQTSGDPGNSELRKNEAHVHQANFPELEKQQVERVYQRRRFECRV